MFLPPSLTLLRTPGFYTLSGLVKKNVIVKEEEKTLGTVRRFTSGKARRRKDPTKLSYPLPIVSTPHTRTARAERNWSLSTVGLSPPPHIA
jgi:hypothetical protein